jgi:hypothetical protein
MNKRYNLVIKSKKDKDQRIGQADSKKEGLILATAAAGAAKDEGFDVVGSEGRYFVAGFNLEYWLVLEKDGEPEEVDWGLSKFLKEVDQPPVEAVAPPQAEPTQGPPQT